MSSHKFQESVYRPDSFNHKAIKLDPNNKKLASKKIWLALPAIKHIGYN